MAHRILAGANEGDLAPIPLRDPSGRAINVGINSLGEEVGLRGAQPCELLSQREVRRKGGLGYPGQHDRIVRGRPLGVEVPEEGRPPSRDVPDGVGAEDGAARGQQDEIRFEGLHGPPADRACEPPEAATPADRIDYPHGMAE